MLKNRIELEEAVGAPALTPDLLRRLKNEDMKQAIVERFSVRCQAPAPRNIVRSGARSPYWQSIDDEC